MEYYEDNKEMNLRLFKLKFAHVFNDVFNDADGLTSVKLVIKLINITSKEDYQLLIDLIKTNKDKIFEHDEFKKFVIQTPNKRGNSLDAVKVILQFNKAIQPYLT